MVLYKLGKNCVQGQCSASAVQNLFEVNFDNSTAQTTKSSLTTTKLLPPKIKLEL